MAAEHKTLPLAPQAEHTQVPTVNPSPSNSEVPTTNSAIVGNQSLNVPKVTAPIDQVSVHTVHNSDSQSTLDTVSHHSSPGVTQIVISFPTMEIAYKELQNTPDEATAYRDSANLHPQHLRLHIDALKEDVDMLTAYNATDEEFGTLSVQLVHAAKRMRRHLERDLVDLQIAGKTETTIVVEPSSTKKGNSLKLTPLQLPSFNGNATQFPVYKNFFEENIINNAEMSETSKWLRLKQSLSGQPAELISELPQNDNTLKLAWKLLTDIYGGDEWPVVDLYNKLQNLPPSSMATDRLRLTHSKLEGLILSLEELGQDADVNHFVKWTYMGKFPSEILYQVQKKKDTTLKELRLAISDVITARECTDAHQKNSNTRSFETNRRSFPVSNPTQTADSAKTTVNIKKPSTFPKPLKCTFCEGQHWNDQCTVYPSIATRTEKLIGKCLKCLRNSHSTPCAEERRCYHCDSLEHNRALCPVKFGTTQNKPKPQLAILQTPSETTDGSPPTGNFLTCVVRATSNYTDKILTIRIVLDTAAGATLVSDTLAKELNIPASNDLSHQHTGLNGVYLTSSQNLQGAVNLLTNDGETIPIVAAVIQGGIPDVPTANVADSRRNYPQYNHVDIPDTGAGLPIDLLVGSDTIVDVLKPEKINAIDADTLLLPTKFGYFIVGRRRQQNKQVCSSMLINTIPNPLQRLADLDIIGLTGIDQADIDDEEKAIQHFYATVQFIAERYSISWPWRTYPPHLDSNFGLALGRLRSLYKKLCKSPTLLNKYHAVIQQQLQQNIIERVTFITNLPVVHYLPHHPIIQPGKSTTVRPVIDGSSKTSPKSQSLNDNIRKGTKWLNDLVTTLLRVRKYRNVVLADIARAFHQIAINEDDRDAARFLWLKNPAAPPTDDNLEVFRFTRVAFGIIASPFLLHAVIRYYASKQQPNEFIQIILKDMYADNLVAALPDNIDPIEFYNYAKQFFGSMSMNLTKWTTNVEELQKAIPEDDQEQNLIQTVLGIRWNTAKHTLLLKICTLPTENQPTPRIIARDMAATFDPLGWAAPIILNAKIFFRNMWEKTKMWDKHLDAEDTKSWLLILDKLKGINEIKLPRLMHTFAGHCKFQLHTFVDASIQAYAVVTYLWTSQKGQIQTTLLMAKSRLTPKTQLTIPKLELVALILGCKLTHFVKDALNHTGNLETFIWSDSKCALAWMTQNKILPPLIEKHIIEAKKFGINNINYVPSELNYADVATRGADVFTLKQMNWWQGPTWLENERTWPQQHPQTQPETETMLYFHQITLKNNILPEKEVEGVATLNIQDFSTLHSLLMRTATCFKALCRFKKENFLNLQTAIDTAAALQWWIYWDQNRIYALQNEPDAGKAFMMRNLTVFRDQDGLIRCQTRIQNSCADLDTLNPILLVKKSTLTKLIILDLHTTHMHVGTSHTLANLRRKYWLPQGRREIYSTILQNCFQCRRFTVQPYPPPPPAPLPEFRVTKYTRPFQAIGLDICGPFYVRQILGRNQPKQKRWILLVFGSP